MPNENDFKNHLKGSEKFGRSIPKNQNLKYKHKKRKNKVEMKSKIFENEIVKT